MISKGEQEINRWLPYIQYTNLPKNDSIQQYRRRTCSLAVLLFHCEFTSNFPSIGEKSHEIESFHNLFSKKQWIGKKKSQIQIWPIYIIASFRIPYFGIITIIKCNSNSACICALVFSSRSGWSFPRQFLFNVCLLDTCMTMDSRSLRVKAKWDTLLTSRTIYIVRARRESARPYRVWAFIRTWVIIKNSFDQQNQLYC